MARLLKLEANKTYASHANAVKAVEKKIAPEHLANQRYIIMRTEDDRYFPVFIGLDSLQAGIQFHFNVLA